MKKDFNLDKFIETTEKYSIPIFNIQVYQHGEKIAEKNWQPIKRRNIYSATKSFTSTAVGFALKNKWFSLDDYVTDLFSGEINPNHSPLLEQMQVRHLLTMTMGFKEAMLMGAQRGKMVEKDWVRFVLNSEMESTPGDTFLYNNAGPYLLGVLIQRFSGMPLEQFLQQKVLSPLGIEPITQFEVCPRGYTFGAGGFYLNVEELAKLGLLYLQNGIWNGNQILPKGWAEEVGKTRTYARGDNVIGYTYGYLFWVGPNEEWYFAHGKYDQICMIVPKKDAVISVLADEKRPNKIAVHAIAKTILPEL